MSFLFILQNCTFLHFKFRAHKIFNSKAKLHILTAHFLIFHWVYTKFFCPYLPDKVIPKIYEAVYT